MTYKVSSFTSTAKETKSVWITQWLLLDSRLKCQLDWAHLVSLFQRCSFWPWRSLNVRVIRVFLWDRHYLVNSKCADWNATHIQLNRGGNCGLLGSDHCGTGRLQNDLSATILWLIKLLWLIAHPGENRAPWTNLLKGLRIFEDSGNNFRKPSAFFIDLGGKLMLSSVTQM